jgi:hypothetical protein
MIEHCKADVVAVVEVVYDDDYRALFRGCFYERVDSFTEADAGGIAL